MKYSKHMGKVAIIFILAMPNFAQSEVSIANNIIGSELIFDNCEKAKNILDTTKDPLSPADKEMLTRYLDRILSLEPQSHQYLKPNPNTFTPSSHTTNLDMANFLDPEREKKAKLCAVEVIPRLLPQSSVTLTELLDSTNDRRNSPELRDQSMFLALVLLQLIQREGFPDYLITETYNKFKSADKILRSKISIPILLTLMTRTQIELPELLTPADSTLRDNMLQALTINYYAESNKLEEITSLVNQIDDGAKAQLISKLKHFAKHHPNLIETLPTLLNTSSDIVKLEASKLTKYLAHNSATYAASYNIKPMPDQIFSQLLEISKIADETLSKDLIKLLLPLDLKADNSFCNQDPSIEALPLNIEEYSHDTAVYFLRKSICPPLKQEKALLTASIKKLNLSEILPRLLTILINEEIDTATLELLAKSAKNIQTKYSSKEYNHFLYLLLESAMRTPNKSRIPLLTDIAIKALGEDLDPTPIISLFLPSSENPAIEFLALNLKSTKPGTSEQKLEQKIAKLLDNKSPLIQRKALAVISKFSEKNNSFHHQTIANLAKLLSDNNIDTRRAAYLILKTIDLDLIKKSIQLKQLKGASQFYFSRILLEHTSKISPNEKGLALQAYIESLNLLDCRERTTAFSDNLAAELRSITPDKVDLIFTSQASCLNESNMTRIRAIKNIFALPLSINLQSELILQYTKFIASKKDPQTISTLLDSILVANPTSKESIIKVLNAALISSSEDNYQVALRWLVEHDIHEVELFDVFKELSNHHHPNISIPSLLGQYSIKKDENILKKIREKFYSNVELSENLLDMKISKSLAHAILSTTYLKDNSYFGLFLNTLACAAENTDDACQNLQISPSLLIDRPTFIVRTLSSLLERDLSTNQTARAKAKTIISTFVQMGQVNELGTLKKTPEVIRILNELRLETSNASHAKILDFVVEQ